MQEDKPYMKSTFTWQAHAVMLVKQECLNTGHFPNGQKMNAKQVEDCKEQISICQNILREHGIEFQEQIKGQLTLF